MAINEPTGGVQGQGLPQQPGAGAGGPEQQLIQRLRQMDQEELVRLAAQLIMRLQEIEASQRQGAAPQQPTGGQTQQPMR